MTGAVGQSEIRNALPHLWSACDLCRNAPSPPKERNGKGEQQYGDDREYTAGDLSLVDFSSSKCAPEPGQHECQADGRQDQADPRNHMGGKAQKWQTIAQRSEHTEKKTQ